VNSSGNFSYPATCSPTPTAWTTDDTAATQRLAVRQGCATVQASTTIADPLYRAFRYRSQTGPGRLNRDSNRPPTQVDSSFLNRRAGSDAAPTQSVFFTAFASEDTSALISRPRSPINTVRRRDQRQLGQRESSCVAFCWKGKTA